jgi:outer membrane protein TolC
VIVGGCQAPRSPLPSIYAPTVPSPDSTVSAWGTAGPDGSGSMEPAAELPESAAVGSTPVTLASWAQTGGHNDPTAQPPLETVEPRREPADFPEVGDDGDEPRRPEEIERPRGEGLVERQTLPVRLEEVVESVYRSFPLLEAALRMRDVADGEQLMAVGNYDLHLSAASENGAMGFYQTYRQRFGLEQPTYWGGQVFAGYRVGRGSFQPWYLERQTNDGGEFRAGMLVPFSRNIDIDPLRAALWRANYGRQLAEPLIQQQLILFIREATYAYWLWVGAGQRYEVQRSVLQLAVDRNEGLKELVEEGELDPPDLRDNERLIVSREAQVIDSLRQLQQAAFGLSVFLRDFQGQPWVPPPDRLPSFPQPAPRGPEDFQADVGVALRNRPELRELDLIRRQLEVDLAQAGNELLPAVDGVFVGSQDVGAPTSPKRDKSQFELDAALLVDVPLQRRRARGKQRTAEGKISQVLARRRLAQDQVVVDVQYAHTSLVAAYQRIEKARESVELANYMAEVERTKFEAGESDLLLVNLREQQAAEAAEIEINALLEYFGAQADLRAAVALDQNPGN